MEPKLNDVLSGRGAWFNQHPGNEHFRRMLEEQKAVYMTGTKKQKMDMAKAIVESIYSMEPPGRFLKKCPGEAGEWKELSRREAADKAAQAMAYAIKGESLKEKRRERRRSRLPPSLRPQNDNNVVEKSSQSDGRPTNNNHNHLGGVPSSPVARHNGLAARGGSGAAGSTTTNAQSSAVNDDHVDLVADGRMLFPDNSNLSQQLTQQFTPPSSSTTTLPTSSGAPPNANQNGLVQVLAQALQQRRRHNLQQQQQQQLPLQHTFGQDPFGLETQTLLQPASLEGLTQQLNQAQQQQYQQQQLLFQHLLNQQNALPSAALPMTTLSLSAPILSAPSPNDFLRGTTSNFSLTGPQSQPANSNLLQYQVHPQSNHPSNALLLSLLSNQPSIGTSIAPPQQASELDQVQRSLVRQQQQLLASSLVASNNNHLLLQQQLQSLPLHQWQAALQLQHNSQDPPLPSLNNSAAELLLSANHRVDPSSSSREEESGKRRR